MIPTQLHPPLLPLDLREDERSCYKAGAIDPISKTSYQGPQDNQREGVISNHVGYPRDKLYHNLLQDWLPRYQKVPEQVKIELFTKFHRPGLLLEGNTQRTRVENRRGNDCISACDKHVPFNKTRDDKENGEIFREKTHQRDKEDNQPLLGPHPFRDKLHPHILQWRVLRVTLRRKRRTGSIDWRI